MTYQELDKWRTINLSYYLDIEKLYQFFVEPNSDILEISSGFGHLLNSLQPQYGLGIYPNQEIVDFAKEKFPHLDFKTAQFDCFKLAKKFDYILLPNTISYLDDIQKAFKNIRQFCKLSTRIIITFHNPGWELILKLATSLNQRTPVDSLNWLSCEDVTNILSLENYEVIYCGKRMLLPRKIPLLSDFFNKIIAPLPIVNNFCLTEYVVARINPHFFSENLKSQNYTCSVIIPARNEEKNIENCVKRMPKLGKHTELIFIEGNSEDNTWEEIKKVQQKYQEEWDIKIIQQKLEGKGDAVRQGFNLASGDVLLILDSDLTVKPEDLTYFFEAIASGKCEFANGCRLIYPVNFQAMPWLNLIANQFFATIISYVINVKLKDSLCGTKAISRQNYARIANNRNYFGDLDPFGDFELLFGSTKLGLKIKDIPVKYYPRTYGQSNIRHFKEGLVLLQMCLSVAWKIKSN
jgi:SAM-dependent methyltransferase